MPKPYVSIVLCTYNRGRTIGRAIRSVFRQTWKDWELIIVDDGSTDGSGTGLRALARNTRRVRYVRQRNQGVAAARTAGSSRFWIPMMNTRPAIWRPGCGSFAVIRILTPSTEY
jgi:glycosyltransferase involved in cell wall biosynthesis